MMIISQTHISCQATVEYVILSQSKDPDYRTGLLMLGSRIFSQEGPSSGTGGSDKILLFQNPKRGEVWPIFSNINLHYTSGVVWHGLKPIFKA